MKLNFKTYNFNTKHGHDNALIFDIIRKKYVKLTPEEWVRQHIIRFLIEEKGVPPGLVSVERLLKFNGLTKRFDICIANREGKFTLLVECKAPGVALSAETIKQAGVYQLSMKVRYIFISNGLQHIFLELPEGESIFRQVQELPSFQEWS